MKTTTLKNIGLFASGLAVNGYLFYLAGKAQEQHKAYFERLSPEEKLKSKAMHAYLLRASPLYEIGSPIGTHSAIIQYNQKSEKEKEAILAWYTKALAEKEKEEKILQTRKRFHEAMKKP